MTTERARQLLSELLKEPGVSGVLLPSVGGKLEVRLELSAQGEEQGKVKALFGDDSRFGPSVG